MSNRRRAVQSKGGAGRTRKVIEAQLTAVRHTRQWILGLVVLCVGLGAAYVYLSNIGGDPEERDVNLQVTSGQGDTSWRLAAGFSGMPVLCGCADPTGHELGMDGTPWEGTLIPADQFTLSVEGDQPWAFQAMAPDSGPASWSGAGIVPLDMRVTVEAVDGPAYQWDYSVKIDETNLVSSDGVYGLTLDGFKSVDVDVEDKWPLISVLSPSGSSSAVHVESGARPYEAAAAGLIVDVPTQSSEAQGVFVNVANKATLTAVSEGDARVIVGTRVLQHIDSGSNVEIELSSPIGATQLMAFPETAAWREQLNAVTAGGTDVTAIDIESDEVPKPYAIDPPTSSLPPHVIRLDSILTPSESEWQAFLKRATPKDPDQPTGLPPLPSDRRIEIFGPVEELQSRAMSGSVSVGSQTWAITQADELHLQASDAIATGKWTPTLGISVGATPVETSISTKGSSPQEWCSAA